MAVADEIKPDIDPDLGPGHSRPAGRPTDPRGHDVASGDSSDPRGEYDSQKTPAGNSSDPRGDLRDAERAGSTPNLHNAESSSEREESGLYRDDAREPSRRRIRFNKKKAAILGGAAGILGGGLIGMFSVIQGPAQFIHLAELLQKYHFAANNDATDSRTWKMARYIYHRSNDQVYKTNLGYFQNKYADRVSERLKEHGIESKYNKRWGYKEQTKITSKFLGEKNLSPEQLKTQLQEKYPRLDITIDGDDVVINHKESGPRNYKSNTSFERYSMRQVGYSRVLSSVNGRVMSNRAAYVLHPFHKADRVAIDKFDEAYANWKKTRAEKMSNGDHSVTNKPQVDEKDDPDTRENEAAKAEDTESKATAGWKEFQETKTFKATAGVGAVIGVGCMLKSLDDGYGEIKQAQVIEPAIRIALDILSSGSQTQSGDDTNLQEMRMLDMQLHGKDSSGKKTSFNEAMSLMGEEGKSNQGVPPSEVLTTIGKGSPFYWINEGGLGASFDAVCSTGGQLALGVVGFLTGPVSFIGGEAFSQLFGDDLQKIALDIISGDALNVLPVGADYGNTVNYGARLAANSQMSSNGGQVLTSDEESQLAAVDRQIDKQEFDSKSFLARTFDIKDSRSLISKATDGIDPRPTQEFATSLSGLYKLPSGLFSNFSKMIPFAHAEDKQPYDYGFAKVGFSAEELSSADVENPYKNAEYVIGTILPAHSDYIERAKTCFGVDIDTSTYSVKPSTDSSPSFDTTNSDDCKDKSTDWMKTRFYIFDSNIATSASCYEGDDQACTDLGMSSSVGNNTTADSSTVSGDAQELAQQILDNKNIDLSAANFCRYCYEDIKNTADGKPAYGDVSIDINILKFLVDLGSQTPIDINSITGAGSGHSDGSNHYSGKAVDFGCGFNEAKADEVAKKYDLMADNERCDDGVDHSHFSQDGF